MKTGALRGVLKLGFVPLADCAPIVMAQELGLFEKHGLRVVLHRELGWATVRDKIIHGELHASHALAAMPAAATLGLGSIAVECITALVLNLHGNAITLSNELHRIGVRDGAGLRDQVIAQRHRKIFTFGIVSQFSSHNFLLRKWLSAAGINPDRDVRIVVVPPPQMVANLKAGHLDGFCVGEPWNSVAVRSNAGWCVAVSSELQPGHPEKVLMLRRDFAESNHNEHLALVAALLEACEFCERPENRQRVVDVLARPEFVNVAPESLRWGFENRLDFGHGTAREVPRFCVFHGDDANDPSSEKAASVFQLIRAVGALKHPSTLNFTLGRTIFRTDLYQQAVGLRSSNQTSHEKENPESTTVLV